MAAAPAPTARLSKAQLRELGVRRDGPGLVHLGLQSGFFCVSFFAAGRLAAAGDPWAWIAVALCGVSVLSFFPLLHEAGHQTAFERPFLNDLGTWLGALFMLQAPSFFQEFHWEHHRSTQDRDRDPEIANAADLLDGWPTNPFVYLVLASGQPLMLAKLGFTVACALLPESVWAPIFPFARASRRRRIAWESRITLLVLAVAAGIGFWLLPGFAFALLAWPIAHVLLGFYLMPEHTGLPNQGSQLERTRTITSNRAVRWLMWNMPFHAEHHLHPSIPFHALPAAHESLAPSLVNVCPGYRVFHAEAIARALHLR